MKSYRVSHPEVAFDKSIASVITLDFDRERSTVDQSVARDLDNVGKLERLREPASGLQISWKSPNRPGCLSCHRLPDTPRRSRTVKVFRWLVPDPGDEFLDFRHSEQCFDGRETIGQFTFREMRVDMAMANSVQVFCRPATLALGHQMVCIEL